jgi:radical SAM-linked protein
MMLRVRFAKWGKLRWISHRDTARAWERAVRRTGLPVAWSAGFTPRPKLAFGLALPTGAESVAEYLDIELSEELDVDDALLDRLRAGLVDGITPLALAAADRGARSLQADVSSCEWLIDLAGDSQDGIERRIAALLEADSAVVGRHRKGAPVRDDIRPSIETLTMAGAAADGNGVMLRALVATKPRGVRPADLASALGPGLQERRSLRIEQFVDRQGAREAVLPVRSPVALMGVSA